MRDLTRVSGLIDATVAEGANELQGIQFTFLDEEASRDAARAEAMRTARARADAYAEAAGMRVARVLEITEPGAEPMLRPERGRRVMGLFNSMGAQAATEVSSAAP